MKLLTALVLLLSAALASTCSHFTMNNHYVITGRTEDLTDRNFTIFNKPKGSKGLRASVHGYVAIRDSNIRSGLNDAGLMCDKQTLHAASHPAASKTLDNIDAAKICQWALEGYGTIDEIQAGLHGVNFVQSKDPAFARGHWAFRDAGGRGLVIEFTNNSMQVYQDNNDDGETGYGIMTNDPPLPEHFQQIGILKANINNYTSQSFPFGSWSSSDRFNRVYVLKANMPEPTNSEDAIMQAIHVVNSVSLPGGHWTSGYQTQWAVVYDQKNRVLYWRSHNNQSMQRLRLADVAIAEGGDEKQLDVFNAQLPWFTDAASVFNQ